jgi:DNA mismatch repair ATPase MutL
MAKHDIEATLPAHAVINTDISIKVKSDGKLQGELLVSKGSLDWRPAKHQYSVSMRWETFARLMERWHNGELH